MNAVCVCVRVHAHARVRAEEYTSICLSSCDACRDRFNTDLLVFILMSKAI